MTDALQIIGGRGPRARDDHRLDTARQPGARDREPHRVEHLQHRCRARVDGARGCFSRAPGNRSSGGHHCVAAAPPGAVTEGATSPARSASRRRLIESQAMSAPTPMAVKSTIASVRPPTTSRNRTPRWPHEVSARRPSARAFNSRNQTVTVLITTSPNAAMVSPLRRSFSGVLRRSPRFPIGPTDCAYFVVGATALGDHLPLLWMGIAYRIDRALGFTLVVWHGDVTAQDAKDHLVELAADRQWPPGRLLLTDISSVGRVTLP